MSLTVAEAIASRRATRKYLDKEIPEAVLDRVVEQALEAPSAFNLQLRDLVVVRDAGIKQALFEASNQRQFLDAPVVLISVARAEAFPDDVKEILPTERLNMIAGWQETKTPEKLREAALKDAMLVSGFALLAAQAEGLATSPTTGWDEEKVKAAIGIGGRADRAIGMVIAVGYPDEAPQHPGRQSNRRVENRY
ncbi:nitroreductase family protein [Corynebacterium freiburgense]|uniref:nitroreductase family protein n=1 Tax=Corynebacterium freiburgense TaxID=556548 RepID=UPI00040FEA9A|nr:nitroreductase family protein [Corynebacterium freiburgense]WJZ01360.1 NADH dehydrogenase [Corynebacterium freiburgense]